MTVWLPPTQINGKDNIPNNALDIFIEKRLGLIIGNIKLKLEGISIEETDTGKTKKVI